MKTKTAVFIILFLLPLLSFSTVGIENYDSLRSVVQTSKKINLDAYKPLLSLYADQNPDSVLSLSKKLLELSTEQENIAGESMAYVFLGDYCSEIGDHKQAIEYLNKAKKFYMHKHAYRELAEVYNLLGNVYYRKGEFMNALDWYKRELKLTKGLTDEWISHLSQLNLGRTYIRLGKKIKGEKIILAYVNAARELNKKKELANAFNILGGYYQAEGDYNLSHSYFQEALEINLEAENLRKVAHSYNNLGISFFYQGKKELSKAYFIKSLKIRQKLGIKNHIAESFYNIGDWFFYNGKYDSAHYYYQKSYNVGVSGNSFKDMGDALLALCEVEKAQSNFESAMEYYEKYTSVLKKQYDKNIVDASVSEFNQMIQEKKMNMKIAKTERKFKRMLERQYEVKKWLLLGVILLLITGSLIMFLVFKKRNKEKSQTSQELKRSFEDKERMLKAEKETLSTQLNLVNSTILGAIRNQHSKIHLFCNETIEKTRLLKVSKDKYFIWEAPIDLPLSILMYLYLEKHKDELDTEKNIDKVLSNQTVAGESKIEWMLLGEKGEIITKSGFSHLKNKRLLSFAKDDLMTNTLVVHSKFPESKLDELILMQKTVSDMGQFSNEMKVSMLHQLKKGLGETNCFCVLFIT